jgi:hypothetical protein
MSDAGGTEPRFECGACFLIVPAKWDRAFMMYLPASGYWVGKPNKVEQAFCSAECSTRYHRRKTSP